MEVVSVGQLYFIPADYFVRRDLYVEIWQYLNAFNAFAIPAVKFIRWHERRGTNI